MPSPPDHLPHRSAPPAGDVAGAVGWVGLGGLLAWVILCHGWPAIVVTLGMPGPRQPLSGPHAALVGLFAAALPMVLWSLMVEKVHRRPSNGIAWGRARGFAETRRVSLTKLAGLWGTWALIGGFYGLARWYGQGAYPFAMTLLSACVAPLLALSVPYVLWLDRMLVEPRDATWHFGALLLGRKDYDPAEVARHLRSWAVKGFFIAFMLSIVPGNFAAVVASDWHRAMQTPEGLTNLLINLLFMIDVEIGMVGYVLTLRPLDSQIRSAQPWLAGWVAALICYPPFLLMASGGPLDHDVNTASWSYWLAGAPALMWLWSGWLVLLTGIYAWATVAFGLRFSNLTYRGVVTNGPYRLTRHPAYLAKNIFWWSAQWPFLVTSGSWVEAMRNTAAMAMVSAVYVWRAKTEERHLLAEDATYRAYWAWTAEHAPITRVLARLFAPKRMASLTPAPHQKR